MKGPRSLFYEMIPNGYRLRDRKQGYPLRALLEVMEAQFHTLRNDIDALYENEFVETCDAWVLPYLGDLLGIGGLSDQRHLIFRERSLVANTIGYRRRKGLPATLEHVAQDVTGWAAHLVEFFELLATNQWLDNVHLDRGRTVDVRAAEALANLPTPFNTIAHTPDVRAISGSADEAGLPMGVPEGEYNIKNIGLFLWRLQAYGVTLQRPRRIAGAPKGAYTFNPLGVEGPLFNQPQTEMSITERSTPMNVPMPLSRVLLREEVEARRRGERLQTDFLGDEPAFQIFVLEGKDDKARWRRVSATALLICDLSIWQPPTVVDARPAYEVAVDPECGRLLILGAIAALDVRARYAYGFSGDKGGGPYTRHQTLAFPDDETWFASVRQVSPKNHGGRPVVWFGSLHEALLQWSQTRPSDLILVGPHGPAHRLPGGVYFNLAINGEERLLLVQSDPDEEVYLLRTLIEHWACLDRKGIIRIADSGTYPFDLPCTPGKSARAQPLDLQCQQQLVVEAADGQCPCLTGLMRLKSSPLGSHIVLNGLWLDGPIELHGDLKLDLIHCTVRPPSAAHNVPSLSVLPEAYNNPPQTGFGMSITIAHSIVGSLLLPDYIAGLKVTDSIVDGGRWRAISAPAETQRRPWGRWRPVSLPGGKYGPPTALAQTTVFGRVHVSALVEASDVIFTGPVSVQQRESGFVRYCVVPENSETPRSYRCQPETAHPRARPSLAFTSQTFGQPGYAQLRLGTDPAISAGASDGAEMGAFHNLYQPQRQAHLRASLDAYLPYGLALGIFYVT